ncbi:MAG: AAA family ATPase [Verrucomicrobiota bacterium]|nr:AAA family ATPase [Verrucomicrobiota bacterium]MDQ6940835.1 AAA family ATPase [Verrucomicrobiota bacterium]
MKKKVKSKNMTVSKVLRHHFGKTLLEDLITARRTFPITSQVDLQVALDRVLQPSIKCKLIGLHAQFGHETLIFAHLLRDENYPVLIGPLQFDEVDVGEVAAARCLRQGLWLLQDRKTRCAVLLTPAERYGRRDGIHLEIAVPPGQEGLKVSRDLLDRVEKMVNESGSYRGRVISLEVSDDYSGRVGSVKVHRLRSVVREDVILPEKTLTLLERNVSQFISQRDRLRKLGMAIKKGLLFYGPPGTGKTHTIHYLASQLPNHTTLLITAEQVALLDEYFQLARFLQPAMLIIEDVDLIARARETMRNACEESLLNRLLNEMDGLREDAAVLFVLTTNRPDQLEAALASRPGRIDQAIEFPLPDEDGRRKLVHLYARGLKVPEKVVSVIVAKTNKASAAFIKELMRRCAQYFLQTNGGGSLAEDQVEAALDEMLFSGGSLNVKLLGGAIDA